MYSPGCCHPHQQNMYSPALSLGYSYILHNAIKQLRSIHFAILVLFHHIVLNLCVQFCSLAFAQMNAKFPDAIEFQIFWCYIQLEKTVYILGH